MDKVSVIVPNYNTEKYIDRCIESLVNQTYKNIEIIIVDDASKDNSIQVIKKYQKKYENILLIELENNKGVSNARNIGIKRATGKYIMFSDSDDWYEVNAVEKLITKAQEENSDFVTANYYINKKDQKVKVDTSNYFSKEKIKKEEIISYMTLTSCSKLITKELFIKNNIWYPEDVKRCEELTVIPVLAYLAEKPIAIDDVLYNYFQRNQSASNRTEKDVNYFEITFNRFVKVLDEKKYKNEIEFRAIEHLLYSKVLVMLKSKFPNKDIKKYIFEFKNKYKNFKRNKYLSTFNLFKKVFIKTINSKILILHKCFAILHKKITG